MAEDVFVFSGYPQPGMLIVVFIKSAHVLFDSLNVCLVGGVFVVVFLWHGEHDREFCEGGVETNV